MLVEGGASSKKSRKIINMDGGVVNKKNDYKREIVWKNVLVLVLVHMAGIYGVYTKFYLIPKWPTIIFNIIQVVFHGLGVTAGRHRLWSHRSYTTHISVEIFLMLLAASAFEQSIFLWCRDHRLHHKHSDTNADPYNSRRGFFFCHIGWICLRKHPEVSVKGATLDLTDLYNNPVVMFEHRHNKLLMVIFTLLLPCSVPLLFWQERWQLAVFYCCFWRLLVVLHMTWSVNSFAHLYGYRPYDKQIQPVENNIVAVISAGEGFHNYHHVFPRDYKAAELSADNRNVTRLFIDLLAYYGLVYERHTIDEEIIRKRIARTGNTLELNQSYTLHTMLTVIALFVII